MKHYFFHIFVLSLLAVSCKTANSQVYICTGPYSKAYHKTSECMGLSRCSGDIEGVSEDEAIEEGRHKCHFCYD
jgi:hypothetical protein